VLPPIHKHWIVLAKGLAAPTAAACLLVPLVLPHGGAVAGMIVLALAGLPAAWVWLAWLASTVTITDERVIIQEGVMVRKTKVIPLDRVQDVSTRQNLFGQLFGYGTLEIDTAGRIENEVVTQLPDPQWLREQVFTLLDSFWRGSDTGL
jgi:uncharacterized membrane protein YdbT with pleckstrin-like domain